MTIKHEQLESSQAYATKNNEYPEFNWAFTDEEDCFEDEETAKEYQKILKRRAKNELSI